jgi:AraC-like DNA-binding protein
MMLRIQNMTARCTGGEAMPEKTIAAGAVRALMELAVSKGASLGALAERSRIATAELQDDHHRIPFARYVALMKAGQELCHDPALALHFGEQVDGTEISIACVIGGFAENMTEAFALLNRYAPLSIEVDSAGSGDRFVLTRRMGHLWMVDTRKNPNDFPELTESTFARMVCMSRRGLGENIVKAVHVTHPEPGYRAEYDRIFRMPVVFGSDRNALLIADGWLAQRLPSSSRPVLRILCAHAETLLHKLESSKSARGCVESSLMPILHTGDATVDAVAGKLGLSRQTLFRKLKAEGVTFERVLDELRHKLALEYLSGKQASVKQTAHLLGFSEPAAFSRAFKRWTGSSPRMMLSK